MLMPAVITHSWMVIREVSWHYMSVCLWSKQEDCSHRERFLGFIVVSPWCFPWDLAEKTNKTTTTKQRSFYKRYQFHFLSILYYWIIEYCFLRAPWLIFIDGCHYWALWSYWTGIVYHNFSLDSADLDLSLELEYARHSFIHSAIRCVFV